jgi:uncharacterized protein YkwD
MRRPAVAVDALSMRVSRLGLVLRSAARVALPGLIVALAVAAPATASAQDDSPAQASQAACPTAGSASEDARRVQKALLCLHNLERHEHGLSTLRWSPELAAAATRHARDMVARHYFEHVSPSGKNHMDRIATSGYKPAVGCWTAGENLFFSSGPSTPRQMLNAWMNSPAHRDNVLRRGWGGFGLGVVPASPHGDAHGVTVVALFGVRSKQPCG